MTGVTLKSKYKDKSYSQEAFRAALEEFDRGGVSLGALSRTYGIPRTALSGYINGHSTLGRWKGQQPVLNSEEEEALADWLKEMALRGFGRTGQQLFDVVKRILDDSKTKTKFVNNRPQNDWYYSF